MKYLFIVVSFFLTASIASACSFSPDADRAQEPSDNISKYPTIFVGTVISSQQLPEFAGNTYTFEVNQTFKGDKISSRKISSPGHSCGSFFREGQVGLFFLGEDTSTIDEANPQYFYDSVNEALFAAQDIFKETTGIVVYGEDENPQVILDTNTSPQRPTACTKEYRPVCGALSVQCITAPCSAIETTYGNECTMRAAGATFISKGECVGTIKKSEMNPGVQDNQLITSPFTFSGTTDNSGDWNAFEGQVGSVMLKDDLGVVLSHVPLSVQGEWMHVSPHDFSAELVFETSRTHGELVFQNERVSGEENEVSVVISVKFSQNDSGEFLPPTTGPLVGFVEPTTPPPSDEKTDTKMAKKHKIKLFFKDVIHRLLPWLF